MYFLGDMLARKLSAYNKHVQREMRAGKTMKEAAKSWRAKKSGEKTGSRYLGGKKMTKKKSGLSLGGFSPMGILKMTALYLGTGVLVPRVVPQVNRIPGSSDIATGAVASVSGLPGNAALPIGIAKFLAGQLGTILSGRAVSTAQGLNGSEGGWL